MGTEYSSYQAYLQALLDPDTEADFATVIGLRILTGTYTTGTYIPPNSYSHHSPYSINFNKFNKFQQ